MDYYRAYKDMLKLLIEKAVKTDGYWDYCNILCIIGEVIVRLYRIVSDFEEKSNYWGE